MLCYFKKNVIFFFYTRMHYFILFVNDATEKNTKISTGKL